ncbi:hypothetical protein LIA77_11695 [Sarocladium implicatum]|nr:hypothetical protein LIA77_11695 [Sarocladium implicatum]
MAATSQSPGFLLNDAILDVVGCEDQHPLSVPLTHMLQIGRNDKAPRQPAASCPLCHESFSHHAHPVLVSPQRHAASPATWISTAGSRCLCSTFYSSYLNALKSTHQECIHIVVWGILYFRDKHSPTCRRKRTKKHD